MKKSGRVFWLSCATFILSACSCWGMAAQAQEPAPASGAPPANGQERRQGGFSGSFGAITAIKGDTITLKSRNGDEVKVKVTDKTQYRKEQDAAKLADFKVGDLIMVGGEKDASGTWNARFVASRPAGGGTQIMMGGPGGGMQQMMAEGLGKVFIIGKVKEINGTKLTIDRPDSQSQVIEVDENTSFRKKGESITLADIKPGDNVMGRGQLKDEVFVPTTLTVVDPSQMRIQTTPRR